MARQASRCLVGFPPGRVEVVAESTRFEVAKVRSDRNVYILNLFVTESLIIGNHTNFTEQHALIVMLTSGSDIFKFLEEQADLLECCTFKTRPQAIPKRVVMR